MKVCTLIKSGIENNMEIIAIIIAYTFGFMSGMIRERINKSK